MNVDWLHVGLLAAVAVAGGLAWWLHNERRALIRRAAAAEAERDFALVRERRIKAKARADVNGRAARALDLELAAARRKAAKARADLEGLTPEEILKDFKKLGYLVALLAALVPSTTHAQDVSDLGGEALAVIMERDGAAGFWFPEPAARRILGDLYELREKREMVRIMGEQLTLRSAEVEELRKVATFAEEEHAAAVRMVAAERERSIELERDLGAWWRSSWVSAGVGFIAGAALTLALAFAVGAT